MGRISNKNPRSMRGTNDPAVATRVRNKLAWPVNVVAAPTSENGLLGQNPILAVETTDAGEIDPHMGDVTVYDYGSDTFPEGNIQNAEPVKIYVKSGVMGGGAPAPVSGDILLENGDQILLETSTTEVDGVLILEG